MRPIGSTNHKFVVYEAQNGFYISKRNGETKGIGDGVDMYFEEDGTQVLSGSPRFYELLKADIRTNEAEWLEAYFGDEE